jgi:hypothetical protein
MRRTCLLAACLTIAAATPGALEPGQLEPTGAAAHQHQGLSGTDIAVRIIALPSQADVVSTLASEMRSLGFSDVATSPAVDVRDASPISLLRSGVLSQSSYLSIIHGVKRYREIANHAAVGCYLSHIRSCSEDADVLVLEADAQPSALLPIRIAAARAYPGLDTLQLGPWKVFRSLNASASAQHPPAAAAEHLAEAADASAAASAASAPRIMPVGDRIALGTQAVLYTATGCKRLRAALADRPIEMQYDNALGFLAQVGQLNHFIERPVRGPTDAMATKDSLETKALDSSLRSWTKTLPTSEAMSAEAAMGVQIGEGYAYSAGVRTSAANETTIQAHACPLCKVPASAHLIPSARESIHDMLHRAFTYPLAYEIELREG